MNRRHASSWGAPPSNSPWRSGTVTPTVRWRRCHCTPAAVSQTASGRRRQDWVQELKLRLAEAFIGVLRTARGLAVANQHVASLVAHTADVQNLFDQGM